jgi:hypothetical protein
VIESNNTESTGEGEVFGYPGEDQGQAKKGKPSTCCIPESYYSTLHCFTTVFLIMHCFYIAIVLYIAIVDDLAPQVDLISSIEMTPLVTYSTPPIIRDLMVSIKVFGKLVVEPKTLGWENSQKKFQKWFRKPWSSIYSTEMFSKWFWTNGVGYGRKGVGGL